MNRDQDAKIAEKVFGKPMPTEPPFIHPNGFVVGQGDGWSWDVHYKDWRTDLLYTTDLTAEYVRLNADYHT